MMIWSTPQSLPIMNDADRQILDHFTHTRQVTIGLARRVPDELLARTPEGEGLPLSRLFLHIAGGVDWWMHHVMCDGRRWPVDCGNDREAVVEALGASRGRLVSFFEADDGQPMGQTFSFTDAEGTTSPWVGRDRVLYLTAHEIHHRGKIVLALRQWQFADFVALSDV